MKINRLCLYFLIILASVILPRSVHASELIFGTNGSIRIHNGNTNYININQSSNNLPWSTGVSANGTTNWGVVDLDISPASGGGYSVIDGMPYNYLIFDICSGSNVIINISNSSCGQSCVATGTYSPVSTGQSCTTGNYSGTRRLIQVRIQKWYLNEVAETLEASSYITISNTVGWYNPVTVNQVFLSDEDYTVAYANQEALINKLNSVQTAITNMQNSINSNTNTNAQNIINNQNANAAQAHSDAQATQNKIDGVKDAVKDDNVNSTTGKSFFDNFSDNTHGLSGIITAPLNMINGLVNVSSTSCSDLTGTYQNQNFSIPCGKLLWGHTGISQFNDFYNLVVGGALCYWIIRDLFLTIEALKDPDNDKVEVMSL